jgi:predicted RNA-binding protein with PIN domain
MLGESTTMTRWLIDGMNVIGSRPDRWWRDRGGAMRALAAGVERLAERGDEVTIVFDSKADPPPRERKGVRIRYASARGRNAADDEIAAIVRSDADPASVQVVTSDADLARRVRGHGASVIGAGSFRRALDRP